MAALLSGTIASAYDFEWGDEVTGSIITSLSVGVQMRLSDRDPRTIGTFNGGASPSADVDDGNLNFDKYDITSQTTSISSELRLKWRNYFATVSGTAFFDSIAANNDLAVNGPPERPYRGEYSPEAKDEAMWDAEFREYYAGGNFTVFDRNLAVKVGSQILNWGEAFFTLNGISVINAIDVEKILTPGTELKDALLPVPMVKLDYEIADGLSAEAFVTFGFEPVRLPACGAFLSFSDNGCRGVVGTSLFTDYGDTRSYVAGRDNAADYDNPPPPYGTGPQAVSFGIPLTFEDDPATTDWGVSLRYYWAELNNTEFQFYYAKYRSRLPSIYFKSPESYAEGTGQFDLVRGIPGVMGSLVNELGPGAQQQIIGALSALAPAVDLTGDLLADLLNPALGPLTDALIEPNLGTLPRSPVLQNLDGSSIHGYYPNDLEMFGLAFSATENYTGIAINGEISYKRQVPIALAADFLIAALNQIGGAPFDQATANAGLPLTPLGIPVVNINNIGAAAYVEKPSQPFDEQFTPNRVIAGDERHDVWQAALRFTTIFGGTDWITRLTGATQITGLVEFGALYVDLNDGTDYAATGQLGTTGFYSRPFNVGGVTLLESMAVDSLGPPFGPTWKAPTKWSGGVQGIFLFDYPDLIDGVRLTPSIAFSTGLYGITPAPLPGFTSGLTSILLGLRADFSQRFSISATYFNSFGAGGGLGGSRNTLIDRDFIGINATYQF
ncbi:DUF1302 domain-containing protein [Oleomonas cavernae]|uniref:DUF1302 domain-containing protein n=1 Tax=Oleomonas cavernae TaxID=2320859 RepID=UPI0013146649|nr:DUF1302 family protein [Oleomonas cavernae]